MEIKAFVIFMVLACIVISISVVWFKYESLSSRKIIGTIVAPFAQGYSACGHCGRSWAICQGHSTKYTESQGCFPLCETCWKELTPQERMPYYKQLIWQWEAFSPVEQSLKDAIYNAVLEGK